MTSARVDNAQEEGARTRHARWIARYDQTGLIWLLRGRPVIALTQTAATILAPSGASLMYRRHNVPALGPLGDSLDDFAPESEAIAADNSEVTT